VMMTPAAAGSSVSPSKSSGARGYGGTPQTDHHCLCLQVVMFQHVHAILQVCGVWQVFFGCQVTLLCQPDGVLRAVASMTSSFSVVGPNESVVQPVQSVHWSAWVTG
jgi:hypothetical protein